MRLACRSPAVLAALALAACALGPAGCAVRARMCDASLGCPVKTTCVAGRCQKDGAEPAIQTTRRLVLEPSAAAYVKRGDPATGGAMPTVFALGRARDGAEALFLRFEAPLPETVSVVEAYVLLQASPDVDVDPSPVGLYAERIVAPWDARGVSWARQPPLEDTRSPLTVVSAVGRPLVRVDVRALVQGWQRRDARDQGIAIVADRTTPTGVAFASARLELYVK